jgi:membrane dipeptidase
MVSGPTWREKATTSATLCREGSDVLIIDAHLDLALNALVANRDLTRGAHATRKQELAEGLTDKGRAGGTVAFPELRAGGVGVVLATVLARVKARHGDRLDYRTHAAAYAHAQGELAYYRELERQGVVRILRDWPSLDRHVAEWNEQPDRTPFGLILLMEGADPIVEPGQLGQWWDDGLRVVGLAHYGPSAYAHGTGSVGGLTDRGRALLREMERRDVILDVSHLVDDSFWEALASFEGPVLASHANCRALVPGDRQLSDDMIRALVERDSVIGAALDAWMIQAGWVQFQTSEITVDLDDYVNHIDHVCQVAGDARHAAIGTDLDGGYGIEQTPHGLDTIADLRTVPDLLDRRGYSTADVDAILHGNWLRLFQRAWMTQSQ